MRRFLRPRMAWWFMRPLVHSNLAVMKAGGGMKGDSAVSAVIDREAIDRENFVGVAGAVVAAAACPALEIGAAAVDLCLRRRRAWRRATNASLQPSADRPSLSQAPAQGKAPRTLSAGRPAAVDQAEEEEAAVAVAAEAAVVLPTPQAPLPHINPCDPALLSLTQARAGQMGAAAAPVAAQPPCLQPAHKTPLST